MHSARIEAKRIGKTARRGDIFGQQALRQLDLLAAIGGVQRIELTMGMGVRAALDPTRRDLANLAPVQDRAVRLTFAPHPFAGVANESSDDIEGSGSMISLKERERRRVEVSVAIVEGKDHRPWR